jgi:hypothetical protein
MGTCMVGWARSRFGRLDGLHPEAPIGGVAREGWAHAGLAAAAMHGLRAEPASVVDRRGSAAAGDDDILEHAR